MAEHTEPNRDTLAEEQVESGARHGAPLGRSSSFSGSSPSSALDGGT